MSRWRVILGFLAAVSLLIWCGRALAAGPFPYRLPQGAGVDPQAVTVLGEAKTHHLVRYENMYDIARKYDLGFWELARYHRSLDHFYLPWGKDIDIPTRWIIPERPSYPGYLINVAELRGYRFFPDKHEVRTFPIGVGVLDAKTPFGRFRVQDKSENPGWRIPKDLQWKYGTSFLPHSDENPIGTHWLGLHKYGLHGTHAPIGVGRLVSHGCMRHYPEDIVKLYNMTPVGTTVEIIYEPVKFGFLKGRIYTEIHEDIYFKIPNMLQYAVKKLRDRGLTAQVNWTKFLRAVEERTGAPVDITR